MGSGALAVFVRAGGVITCNSVNFGPRLSEGGVQRFDAILIDVGGKAKEFITLPVGAILSIEPNLLVPSPRPAPSPFMEPEYLPRTPVCPAEGEAAGAEIASRIMAARHELKDSR